MPNFKAFHGTVTKISDLMYSQNGATTGCFKLMSLEGEDGSPVNFVVAPTTYFIDHVTIAVGDNITGYYDTNAPVPFIYPPQYQAIVMARDTQRQNVKVDYFDSQLLSSDGSLKLNITPATKSLLPNDQTFSSSPAKRYLIVVYGPTTYSIPAQTTPFKIIVMCSKL